MLHRITYPCLYGLSYLGTRFVGLEPTVGTFKKIGTRLRKLGLAKSCSAAEIRARLVDSFDLLPVPVRCLDQAIVAWHVLNLHGHDADFKIGVTLAPFASHAWVELGEEKFVDFVFIPDMEVVAEYHSWTAAQ